MSTARNIPTAAARSRTNTFLTQLRNSKVSISDLMFHVGVGYVDPPEILDSPTLRWTWFAELLSNHEWGIATYLPCLADICAETAHLCRQTSDSAYAGDLVGQWDALAAHIVTARHSHCEIGEPEALDMLADLVADGANHCRGSDASGFEALLGYMLTIWRIRGSAAREALLRATESNADPTFLSGQGVASWQG